MYSKEKNKKKTFKYSIKIIKKKKKLMKPFLNKKINISNESLTKSTKKYFIVSSTSCFLTKKQIESCISVVRYYLKRYKKKKKFY